jgi:hypothetical protein
MRICEKSAEQIAPYHRHRSHAVAERNHGAVEIRPSGIADELIASETAGSLPGFLDHGGFSYAIALSAPRTVYVSSGSRIHATKSSHMTASTMGPRKSPVMP